MSRGLGISLIAISAAWILLLKSRNAPHRIIAVQEAAAKLRLAWAKNHTVA